MTPAIHCNGDVCTPFYMQKSAENKQNQTRFTVAKVAVAVAGVIGACAVGALIYKLGVDHGNAQTDPSMSVSSLEKKVQHYKNRSDMLENWFSNCVDNLKNALEKEDCAAFRSIHSSCEESLEGMKRIYNDRSF